MILYAVKDQETGKYWRKRPQDKLELLDFDHCSVFVDKDEVIELGNLHGKDGAKLVEINLTTKEIDW